MNEEIKVEVSALCQGCLSQERKTAPLRDYHDIFYSLLDSQAKLCSLYGKNNVNLCWECVAMLRRIRTFQKQVNDAQNTLMRLLYELDTNISSLSRLSVHKKDHYDCIQEYEEPNESKTIPKEESLSNNNKTEKLPLQVKIEQEDLHSDDQDMTYDATDFCDDVKTEIKTEKSKKSTKKQIKHSYDYKNNVTVLKKRNIKDFNIGQCFVKVFLNEKEVEDNFLMVDRSTKTIRRNKFRCELCNVSFMTSDELKRHHNINHYENKILKCLNCKKKMASNQALEDHWTYEHSIYYKCNICSQYLRKGKLKWHLRTDHTNLYGCNECKHSFSTLREFKEHFKAQHLRCVCDYCGKVMQKKSIEKHIRHQHLEMSCTLCSKVYKNRRQLVNHRQMFHPGAPDKELAYCVECDRQFCSVRQYKAHLNDSARHTPRVAKRIPCPECGKVFSRHIYMKNHYNMQHVRQSRFTCDICNKAYTCKWGLVNHNRNVHLKIPKTKDKICDICGRAFTANRILINHRRTHTGERPHQCPHCAASFAQRTAMTSHVRSQHRDLR